MSKDVTSGWFKFVADCNNDGEYANSQAAGEAHSALEAQWREECPGLELPTVLWSNASGRYELTGLSVPKASD